VVLLQSDHPTLLVTWGTRRPKVILPRGADGWTGDRIRVVLCHELAHIARRDWVLQVTAELLRSVYWFNPIVWIGCRRLRQESEHACDDAVLRAGIDGADYATELLALAQAALASRQPVFPQSPALAIARPSSLERRIRAMLKSSRNRVPVSRTGAFAVGVVWLAAASAVAGFGTPAQTSGTMLALPPAPVVPPNILSRPNAAVPAASSAAVGAVEGATLAQVASFSTFSGSIADQLGGLLPGVTVTLTNPARQSKYEVHTGRNGDFEFVGLPAGEYVLEATLPGFATQRGSVNVGGNAHVDLRLALGTIMETIHITGDRNAPTVAAANTGARAPGEGRGRGTAQTCNPQPAAGGIGGQIWQPRKLRDVRPIYPVGAQSAGVEGVVILEATIGVDGFVRSIEVLRSPDPDLAASAVAAVGGWEFSATQLNCVPVETGMTVTLNYSLKQ
jgi:TonB family protein